MCFSHQLRAAAASPASTAARMRRWATAMRARDWGTAAMRRRSEESSSCSNGSWVSDSTPLPVACASARKKSAACIAARGTCGSSATATTAAKAASASGSRRRAAISATGGSSSVMVSQTSATVAWCKVSARETPVATCAGSGRLTIMSFEPRSRRSSPEDSSSRSASRTVERCTPSCRASSSSLGRRSPSPSEPAVIRAVSTAATLR